MKMILKIIHFLIVLKVFIIQQVKLLKNIKKRILYFQLFLMVYQIQMEIIIVFFIQRSINSTYNNFSYNSKEDINELINSNIELKIINFDIDIQNFNNPIIYSFYSIYSGFNNSTFAINNLNFLPLKLISHNGLFFDSIKEYNYFKYEQNQICETKSSFISAYYFWIQNNIIIYERNYKRIQNVLADFGVISRIISVIASFINWFIYKFYLLKDIQKL